jgi:hypothetical protein
MRDSEIGVLIKGASVGKFQDNLWQEHLGKSDASFEDWMAAASKNTKILDDAFGNYLPNEQLSKTKNKSYHHSVTVAPETNQKADSAQSKELSTLVAVAPAEPPTTQEASTVPNTTPAPNESNKESKLMLLIGTSKTAAVPDNRVCFFPLNFLQSEQRAHGIHNFFSGFD